MTSSSFRKLVEPGERTPTSNVWSLVRRRRIVLWHMHVEQFNLIPTGGNIGSPPPHTHTEGSLPGREKCRRKGFVV